MRAEDFITNILHSEIERPKVSPSKKLSVSLKRYRDGREIFVIPTSIDLDTVDGQRVVWHEIGHHIDKANYLGGRSSTHALITTGKYSTKNRAMLREHSQHIRKNRTLPEMKMRFKVGDKVYTSLEALEADPDVPIAFKVKVFSKVQRAQMQMEDYLDQDIELFADGFAECMVDPDAFADNPTLCGMYGAVFDEEQVLRDVRPKGKVKPRRKKIGTGTALSGMR